MSHGIVHLQGRPNTDGELTVTAELPGLDRQNVRVEVRGVDDRK